MHFINLCRKNELVILNGRLDGDRRGMFTNFQKKGHSVVDYAVATASLVPSLLHFAVGTLLGDVSDHAPIALRLKVSNTALRAPVPVAGSTTKLQKTIWEESAPSRFQQQMLTNEPPTSYRR